MGAFYPWSHCGKVAKAAKNNLYSGLQSQGVSVVWLCHHYIPLLH